MLHGERWTLFQLSEYGTTMTTTTDQHRVAIITGAARGIGLATAKRFLTEGIRVALIDNDKNTLDAAVAAIDRPDAVLAIDCDVAEPEQVKRALDETVSTWSRVDALVNNAGVAVFRPLLDTSFDEWRRVIDVNLSGPFICTQIFAPEMQKTGGGSIVNVASISGLRASLLRVAYETSKAGLIHLTKQQAAELGNVGIRAKGTAPGPVDTAMAKAVHTADIRADYHDAIPLNRYGLEEEIAAAIWFLCSEESHYINGQTIAVDGGFDATGIGLPSLWGQR